MKCDSKKAGAKKGYMAGGMVKKEMPAMKKGGMAKKTTAKKSGKANPFEMMMKAKGRNMAKAKA